nr:FAD-dependent oxidoreductase [Thalassotalea mangrovi]
MLEIKKVVIPANKDVSRSEPQIAAQPITAVGAGIEVVSSVDSTRLPIIVIGSGLAGYNLIKEIRQLDTVTPIYLYTADDGAFYSKPQLSTGFAKSMTAAQLVNKTAEEMALQYDIETHIFTQITAIHSDDNCIELASGGRQCYSNLVLATGASAIPAPIKGSGLSHVYSVNDLQDYNRFRTVALSKKPIAEIVSGKPKVLIIGAGLIGCEYANDLLSAGFEVDIVDTMGHLLASLIPDVAAKAVEVALGKAGARFHFNNRIETLEPSGNGVIATLTNGHTVYADMVLSAIGVRPNLTLAETAGLETDRGIVTNRQLQTSVANIYAIGDCAQVESHLLFYIQPLMIQAKALAKTLTGTATEVQYPVMPVIIKTTLHPVVVSPVARDGNGQLLPGQWQIDLASDTGVRAVYRHGNRVLGYALTGDQVTAKADLSPLCPDVLE